MEKEERFYSKLGQTWNKTQKLRIHYNKRAGNLDWSPESEPERPESTGWAGLVRGGVGFCRESQFGTTPAAIWSSEEEFSPEFKPRGNTSSRSCFDLQPIFLISLINHLTVLILHSADLGGLLSDSGSEK
ncbi:hypothetical protein MHYP_G00016910 [Metynnis hypsauchen]